MVDFWKIGAMAWCLTVLSWFMVPVITFAMNKLFAYLCVDVEQKLKELKVCSIPTLKKMLMDVQEQRILRAAKNLGSESDLQIFDELAKDLRSALYDADDVLDLVDYLQIEKKIVGGRSIWEQHVRKGWFGRSLAAARSRCMQGLDHLGQQLLPLWRRLFAPRGTPEEQQPSPDPEAPGNPKEEQQKSSDLQARRQLPDGLEASLNSVLQGLHSFFLAIYNCCGSILNWLLAVIEFLRPYRDWSYEVVGIKHNKNDGIGLDSLQLMIHGKSLRKKMEHIDSIITVSKKSPLLNEQSGSSELSVDDTDKESSSSSPSVQDKDKESRSKRKEIADMHRNIAQPVFGREKDQTHVSRLLRKGPSSRRYSVIGVHGIAGSGKTTLARCVCDYEKEIDNKYFDPIMFVQVSKTFRVHDIFIDMLMDIVGQDGQSTSKDLKSLESQREELKKEWEGKCIQSLCAEVKEKLKGKRFLLVLDDLWVSDENQEERDIVLDALAAGDGGSRILVTAQKEDAAAALDAYENFLIPDLEEDEYLSLFMHYGLQPGAVDDDGKFERFGRKIVEKLHSLPLAAVLVAKRLRGKNIVIWETTANLDVLNGTMGALWWSYEQLGSEIRRCFEYCSTFPRGYRLERDKLVAMWIAQGFVSTCNATEEPEDVGHRYFDELLTFSFLSAAPNEEGLKIHDLLHELVERVAGSDFFRIGVNGFDSRQGIIPPEVRHVYIETYDRWEKATEQILQLENLRTLIIEENYHPDEYTAFDDAQPDEEKLIEGTFKKMRKLRVLIIDRKYRQNHVFSISESFGQMKHLRFFGFYCWYFKNYSTEQISKARPRPLVTSIIFPSTFTQLYQLQVLVIYGRFKVSFPDDSANNLIHLRRILSTDCFPNTGKLTSLQSMPFFNVKEERGYELRQLKHLNKLRGDLDISGLQNVRSKDEALEGNLAGKTRLTNLILDFDGGNPDVVEDVLEGLLPPKDLEELIIHSYSGSWCPSWMLSSQNPDAPKNLDRLFLFRCSQLVYIPEGSEFFAGLRGLVISTCTWDVLPDHMERLTSLKELDIRFCDEIELLPTTLPQSLESIHIFGEKSKL